MNKGEGLRFNEGKIRMDLLEPWAIEKLAEVFTVGAKKYAPNNWLKGMAWSKVTASLKRHLLEYEKGVDYDEETGLLHAQHIAWNAMALLSYFKHYPEGDDRLHTFLPQRRIGLDIDDVLADWTGEWAKLQGIDRPNAWQFDRAIVDKFDKMKYDGSLDEFYMNLPVLTKPEDIPFEPVCYVTSRPIDSKVTEAWLDKMGFPAAPVCTVGIHGSKVDCIKANNVDIFVDDRFENFVELNKAGICTFLFDRLHNQRYDVGFKRIKSLKEL
jgi:5'(3')-deoxyribonucleotidase